MKLYKPNSEFLIQSDEDTVTIFDPETSQLYTLNETAQYIFNCIQKKMYRAEIVNKIVKAYNVTAREAELEVNKTVDYFLKEKIIK